MRTRRVVATCIKSIVCGIALGIMSLIQGCDFFAAPPVSITFRQSYITGYVMQLHNRSDNRIVVQVYVENDELNQHGSISVGIEPHGMEELGLLEMGWAFMPGDEGYVSVDGYMRKVNFEIKKSGQYRTW